MNASASARKPKDKAGGRSTKVVRVPLEIVDQVKDYSGKNGYRIPRMSGRVPAGFPLNTEEHIEEWVDLNQLIIKHPDQTFIIEATGESMTGAGIREKDLLVVDSAVEPRHGMIVIAAIDGEYTVKRLYRKDDHIKLLPANKDFPEIDITQRVQFTIAGVVIHSLHSFV